MALGHLQGNLTMVLRIRPSLICVTGLAILHGSCPGYAQDRTNETTTASANPAEIKFSEALRSLTEPESPTFQILGVAANEVTRPESPKQAALALLNSLDQEGNLQTGLALEFSPYLLIAGDQLTLQDYKQDWWRRQLSYFQLGLGAVKGASDKDKSVKASIGFLWTPINGMDPYANEALTTCLQDVIRANTVPPPPDEGNASPPAARPPQPVSSSVGVSPIEPEVAAEIASLNARIAELEARLGPAAADRPSVSSAGTGSGDQSDEPEIQPAPRTVVGDGREAAELKAEEIRQANRCFAVHPLLPDNTTSLQFGFAPIFVSESGETDDLEGRGFTATALLTIGLSRLDPGIPQADQYRSQLILSGTYRRRETVADPDVEDAFLIPDRWNVGGRFVYGKPTSRFYSLEGVYQSSDYRDGRSDNYLTVVGGLDVRVAEGLWLGLNAGSSFGRSVGGDDTFIGSRFRWGFGQRSAIGAEFRPLEQGSDR